MCGCAVERLRVYAKAPAGASAPPMVSVPGRGALRDLAGSVGDLAGRRLLGCRGRGGLPGDGGDGGRGPLRPHPAVGLGHLLHVDDIPIEIYRRDLAGIGPLQVLDDCVLREEVVARQAPVAVGLLEEDRVGPLIGVVDERRRLLPTVGIDIVRERLRFKVGDAEGDLAGAPVPGKVAVDGVCVRLRVAVPYSPPP